jgi:hypothetical protein
MKMNSGLSARSLDIGNAQPHARGSLGAHKPLFIILSTLLIF